MYDGKFGSSTAPSSKSEFYNTYIVMRVCSSKESLIEQRLPEQKNHSRLCDSWSSSQLWIPYVFMEFG